MVIPEPFGVFHALVACTVMVIPEPSVSFAPYVWPARTCSRAAGPAHGALSPTGLCVAGSHLLASSHMSLLTRPLIEVLRVGTLTGLPVLNYWDLPKSVRCLHKHHRG